LEGRKVLLSSQFTGARRGQQSRKRRGWESEEEERRDGKRRGASAYNQGMRRGDAINDR
jgi:hypothetical protein